MVTIVDNKLQVNSLRENQDGRFIDFASQALVSRYLSQFIGQSSWRDIVNAAYRDLTPTKKAELLSLLRFRRAGILGFCNLQQIKSVMLYGDELGVLAIPLIKHGKSVTVVVTEPDQIAVLERRLNYYGIDNVELVSMGSPLEKEHLKAADALIFQSSKAAQYRCIGKRVAKITTSKKHKVLCYGEAKFCQLVKKHSDSHLCNWFSVNGHLNQPFAFQQRSVFEIEVRQIVSKIRKVVGKPAEDFCIASNDKIESSEYLRTLSFFRSLELNNQSQISGFFAKPNGANFKLNSGASQYFVRIANDAKTQHKLERAVSFLELHANKFHWMPKIYKAGIHNERYCLVETCFEGENINSRYFKDSDYLGGLTLQALDIQQEILKITRSESGASVLSDLLESEKSDLMAKFSSADQPFIDQIFDWLHKQTKLFKFSSVGSHGDYSVDNLIIKNGKIMGLIDWENCRTVDFPLIDWLFFLLSVEKFKNGTSIQRCMEEKLIFQRWDKEELVLIGKYMQQAELAEETLPALSVLVVLRFINSRLDLPKDIDETIVYESNFLPLLKNMTNKLANKEGN